MLYGSQYNTVEDLPGAKFADTLKAIFSHNKTSASDKASKEERQSRATSKASTPAASTQASRSASVSSHVSRKLYQGGYYPC
ncbi:uncharacterized protein MYCFIDRAFT_212557 [Pseudocercospora fijiensis CIRAD86]|uniref:Uncharacterized protein n=1 Tax=Pseudocercospora fijiensis (strain CIRAD86) TaxID=383855 RepID=M2YJ88_PSEFD|nr:uncharacterized protein MYCFIDRAFT_212557 [Pseudocercospora fijiensis CIRAD86]EME77785.1 hypothetical protein MYCFIDRAFT_212557 [Pseudocercospora fijiensis CIRAD86]